MIGKEKTIIQRILPHVIAIIALLIITVAYFSPAIMDGKIVQQSDIAQFENSAQEVRSFYKNEGESSAWTGTSFSGMPTYQIGVWGGSPNFLSYIEAPVRAIVTDVGGPVLMGMLMAYILFVVMGFSVPIAFVGAVAYGFSSYNIILLDAGHMTKAWAIAYMPLIVSGLLVAFKRKYILGGVLLALGLGLQIYSNHMQMTYYTAMLCAILFIALAVDYIRKKEFKDLGKVTASLSVAVVLGLLANFSGIYNNYLMSDESTRGKSELTIHKDDTDANAPKTSGLDKDYVFQWSYGKSEIFSVLVPNIHGGVSKPFPQDSEPYKAVIGMLQKQQLDENMANQIYSYTTEYWGDQPFTSGPVYFGAIICFLFVLGMFSIRNRLKWVLFGATIFFIFLSWGKNMEWFNDLFYYHFPMYNKFRAVSSILVVPALTMVILAIWGLKDFLDSTLDKKQRIKMLYLAFGITGGLCLLLWIAPGSIFNFVSQRDQQLGLTGATDFFRAVTAARADMLSADALRSFIYILLAAAILWATLKVKDTNFKIVSGASLLIAILVLIDLWGVDRRYLPTERFTDKKTEAQLHPKSTADKFILDDKDPSYRVLQLGNPFQDGRTSYYHKSIGGYSAAKLKRYQELIDFYLDDEVAKITNYASKQLQNEVTKAQQSGQQIDPAQLAESIQQAVMPIFSQTPLLNALNTRYIIYQPELPPLANPFAMDNAWFVQNYKFVDDADAEILALKDTNLRETAVVDKRFESALQGLSIMPDSTATISLQSYKPNKLVYKTKANGDQLAVFSEIYFAEGWEATIDGQAVDYVRADWTLRAMKVPAGEHEIVFQFIPHAYNNARLVATIFSAVLLIAVVAGLVLIARRRKEENAN